MQLDVIKSLNEQDQGTGLQATMRKSFRRKVYMNIPTVKSMESQQSSSPIKVGRNGSSKDVGSARGGKRSTITSASA